MNMIECTCIQVFVIVVAVVSVVRVGVVLSPRLFVNSIEFPVPFIDQCEHLECQLQRMIEYGWVCMPGCIDCLHVDLPMDTCTCTSCG
jgi:hypothetical protein